MRFDRGDQTARSLGLLAAFEVEVTKPWQAASNGRTASVPPQIRVAHEVPVPLWEAQIRRMVA